jgi:ParB family chromosome partitioning protein
MATKHGLGRGLGALLQTAPATDAAPAAPTPAPGTTRLPIERIRKNRLQPRHHFREEALGELAASIKEHGVLQPVLVRAVGDEYELIAGERRYRAAALAGLTELPAVVVDGGDQLALELALVENLQREDLDPLEEAGGYELLMSRFNLTQEQVATRVGKARASVANALRLLTLSEEVRALLSAGEITVGHAKVLVGLEIAAEQTLFARRVAKERLSVRELEAAIKRAHRIHRGTRATRTDIPAAHLQYVSDKLHQHFGTSVRLTSCRTYPNGRHTKGVLEVDFFTPDDLDRILSLLGVALD